MGKRSSRLLLLLAAMVAASCTVQQTGVPPLAGPSEFALAVTMTAIPDQLPRDGSSVSVVTLTARDSQGKAVAGQRLSLSVPVGSPVGVTLSQSEVVTDGGGVATFSVSAPAQGSTGNAIVVNAVPVGTNADNATPRRVSIRVTPSNGTAPTAAFTVNPATPEIGQLVTFDASTTTDEGVACTTCTFAWDFGTEGTATGRVVTHTFGAGGPYIVTLVATDSAGSVSTPAQRTVTVAAINVPVASFVVSPASPVAGQAATFTATATVQANHRIVTYSWSWGDGSGDNNASGPTIQHTFLDQGRFLVTLTVRDDLAQSATSFVNVVVGSGLVASFTAVQVPPSANHTMNFDAAASVSNTGTTISDYAWDFGDGSSTNGAQATVQHQYGAAGNYTVKLTITDGKGRTASTTVPVSAGGGSVTVQ